MKALPAIWLWCSLAAVAQTPPPKSAPPAPVIKCKNIDGLGCTYRQVKELSDAVFAGKSQHDVLVPVKDVALAAADGTLRCAQSNGAVCSTAELDVIKQIGSTLQLTIKYTNTK